MDTLLTDIRYGIRTLLKSPGFTAVAILTLALGIGANTAIFSVVNSVVLKPLPFPDPKSVLLLGEGGRGQASIERNSFSFPDYRDLLAQTQTLDHVAAFLNSGSILSTNGSDAERVLGADVSAEFFDVLGVKPQLGRVFTADEDRPNSGIVVISHALWQRRFGGRVDVIGQPLKMGAVTVSVIGVMPSGFSYPIGSEPREFWEPLNDRPLTTKDQRDYRTYRVIARLKPNVSLGSARVELDTISRRLEQAYPKTNTTIVIAAGRIQDDLSRDARPALFILLGAVAFVLLIACANVANLQLARATSRQREIAVRNALGASRWRIVRQLLVETLMLAIVGGVLGLLVTSWLTHFLIQGVAANIPRINEVAVDRNVLAFTALLSLLTGLAFGLVPALQVSSPHLVTWLKDGSRGSTSGPHSGLTRSLLVVSEVALSLMLLVGAGLLLKSFVRLMKTDPGFDTSQVLAMDIPLSRQRYDSEEKQMSFFDQLVERTKQLPGVEAAALVNNLPLSNSIDTLNFNVAGRPSYPLGTAPEAFYTVVSPDYFETVKIPLRAGRLFSKQDTSRSPRVTLISESLARHFFSSENPIGLQLVLDPAKPPLEVVGIVGDARRRALDTPAQPEFYVPFAQAIDRRMNLMVRTSSPDPLRVAPSVRQAISELDRDQTIWQTRTLDQLASASVADRRFSLWLLGVFACIALLLAVIGIYGVMMFSVKQRTHEIGIRMAVGAGVREVMSLVIGKGMRLAFTGAAVGIVGALVLTRLMTTLLYEVRPTDVLTYASVSIGLMLIALVACYIPARRAARVDPLVALREE